VPIYSMQQLRKLIGVEVVHQGLCCQIVEILEHEPALVLQSCGPREGIQDNQFGDPHRRVPEVFTIALFDEQREGENHPDFLALGLPLE
jgi:hypothetical protein